MAAYNNKVEEPKKPEPWVAEGMAEKDQHENDVEWLRKESTFADVHKLFGPDVPHLWEPMKCPIKGLGEYVGNWIQADGGEFVFNVFHADGNIKKTLTLVEFYASQVTESQVLLEEAGERGIWLTRMLAEIKAIELPDVSYRLLGSEWSKAARRVYDGFIMLVRCHLHYDSSRPESCFALDFGSKWCGVALNTFRQYRTQLEREKYIQKTGEKVKGKTFEADLYKLIPG